MNSQWERRVLLTDCGTDRRVAVRVRRCLEQNLKMIITGFIIINY